jgi:hypothetical protein
MRPTGKAHERLLAEQTEQAETEEAEQRELFGVEEEAAADG